MTGRRLDGWKVDVATDRVAALWVLTQQTETASVTTYFRTGISEIHSFQVQGHVLTPISSTIPRSTLIQIVTPLIRATCVAPFLLLDVNTLKVLG
jgi:hypothetical protein